MFRKILHAIAILAVCLVADGCSRGPTVVVDPAEVRARLEAIPLEQTVSLTNDEWKAILSPLQFYVMRRDGTEQASNAGNRIEHQTGSYVCAACGNPLFAANTKFDSGTGWPSFWQPAREQAVHASAGVSAIFGTEISCARCGSHLGHVFKDGPPPTGLRYCMNAVALSYRETP